MHLIENYIDGLHILPGLIFGLLYCLKSLVYNLDLIVLAVLFEYL